MIPALDADLAGLDVARADLDADGHALFHPLPLLHAAVEIAGIDMDADRVALEMLVAEGFCECLAGVEHGCAAVLLGRDRQDHDLLGGDARWQDQAVIVRVRHDERADQAGGDPPGSGVGVLDAAVAAGEGDVLRL